MPVQDAILNPGNPDHFMRLKPAAKRVTIRLGDTVLAESTNATRLLEAGRDLYDPVLYIPPADVAVPLQRLDKSTHCPLKGDAAYYTASLPDGSRAEEIGWSYEVPLDFAAAMAGLIAFDPARVTVTEAPLS